MSRRERLLIAGGGMAAGRLLQALVRHHYRGSVTVVGAEHLVGYNRVLLPGYLAGNHSLEALTVLPEEWFAAHDVALVTGDSVSSLDLTGRQVTLASGRRLPFDRLVLATGATVPVPDIAGLALPGVTTLRCLDDVRRLRQLTAEGGPVVVVGGGLLGLETAKSLLDLGLDVHVVHRRAQLLNRQLDADGAACLRRALESRGIRFALGAGPAALEGSARVSALRLENGRRLPAATVVFATGTRPRDELASAAGLVCDGGVVVNERLETSRGGVYAVGECARVAGRNYALVTPVFRQAEVLAATLCGGHGVFRPPPAATRLKISGLDVYSAGDLEAGPAAAESREVRISDPGRGIYRRLVIRNGRLAGAVLVGDAAGNTHIESLIEDGDTALDAAALHRAAFALDAA